MRRALSAVAAIALVAGIATAQPHPHGYATGQINFSKTATEPIVSIIDAAGNVVTSVAVGTNNCHGLVMGPKNELLYASELDGGIYMIDPMTGTNLGTFVTLAGVNPRDLTFDQNGDLFIGSTAAGDNLYKVDGVTQAVTTLFGFGTGWDIGEGGVNIDIDTGELLVLGDGNGDPLWRMNRDGSSYTTIATGMVTRYGFAQHIPTGDIYSGTGGSDYLRLLPAGTSVSSVWISQPNASNMYCVKCDRASAATQTLVGGLWGSTSNGNGVETVDIATKTVTSLNSTITSSIYEIEILYRKNVSSARGNAAGQWTLYVHVPEDATKRYNLVVGASGVRPGVGFASGRTAYLNPDILTFTGLTFGLAPFLQTTSNPGSLRGTLDNLGKDTATLDLSALGPAANGTRLWFLVLTEDSSAPEGFGTITDPHVIKIEGL